MNKINLPILLLLMVALTYADQEVPLRKNGYGFTVGDKNGNLSI